MTLFPNMTPDNHSVESDATDDYNCIAWACGRMDVKMWPKLPDDYFWPQGVLNEPTVAAFVDLFSKDGYEVCTDGQAEAGMEKVAIYALEGSPGHVALQLADGRWTSKIGDCEDIYHDDPSIVETERDPFYGQVAKYMRRPRKAGS